MCACPASHQDILKSIHTRNTFDTIFIAKSRLKVLLVHEARQELKAMIYMVLSVHDMNPVFDTKITTTAS